MATFSERLRQLRTAAGLSQMEFSKRIGVSKSSVNMYERGEREPNLETLQHIADFFQVDIGYLLGKSESAPPVRSITDDDIKLALFGGSGEITDAMYDILYNGKHPSDALQELMVRDLREENVTD